MPWKLKRPKFKFEKRLEARVKYAEEASIRRTLELEIEHEKFLGKVEEFDILMISYDKKDGEVTDLQGKLTSSTKKVKDLELSGVWKEFLLAQVREHSAYMRRKCSNMAEKNVEIKKELEIEKRAIEEDGQVKLSALHTDYVMDGARAQVAREELQKTIHDLEATNSKLEEEKIVHVDNMAELRAENLQLREVKMSLEQTVIEKRKAEERKEEALIDLLVGETLAQTKCTELQTKIHDLEATNSKLEEEKIVHVDNMAELRAKNLKLKEVEKSLEQAVIEKGEIEGNMAELRAKNLKLKEVEKSLEQAVIEKGEIEEKGQVKLSALHTDYVMDGARAQVEREELQTKIHDLEATNSKLEEEKIVHVDNMAELRAENLQLREVKMSFEQAVIEKRKAEERKQEALIDLLVDGTLAQTERAEFQTKIHDLEATNSKLEEEKVTHVDDMAELLAEVLKLRGEITRSNAVNVEVAKLRVLLEKELRSGKERADKIIRLEREAEASRKSHNKEIESFSREVQRVHAEQAEFRREMMGDYQQMADEVVQLRAQLKRQVSACKQPNTEVEAKVGKKKPSKSKRKERNSKIEDGKDAKPDDKTPEILSEVPVPSEPPCAATSDEGAVSDDDMKAIGGEKPKAVSFAKVERQMIPEISAADVDPFQRVADRPPILKKPVVGADEVKQDSAPVATFDVEKLRQQGERYSASTLKPKDVKPKKKLVEQVAADRKQPLQPEAGWQTVSYSRPPSCPRRSSVPVSQNEYGKGTRRRNGEKPVGKPFGKPTGKPFGKPTTRRTTTTKQRETKPIKPINPPEKQISLEEDFPPLEANGGSLLTLLH